MRRSSRAAGATRVDHVIAVDAKPLEQLGQADIADDRATDGSAGAAIERPGSASRPPVQPRQHHGAARQAGDASESSPVAGMEPVEPAAMTGPAGGLRAQSLGFGSGSARRDRLPDWSASARRRRPATRRHDRRKSSVTCHQPARSPETSPPKLRPVAPLDLHLVHQRGEVAGQPDGVRGRSRHDDRPRRTSLARWAGSRDFQARTSGASSSSRSIEAIGGARSSMAAARLKQSLVLIELTERTDHRQDRGREREVRQRWCARRERHGASAHRWSRRQPRGRRRRRHPHQRSRRAARGDLRQEGRPAGMVKTFARTAPFHRAWRLGRRPPPRHRDGIWRADGDPVPSI